MFFCFLYSSQVKTKLLSEIKSLSAEDFVTGQYKGYLEEEGVPEGSVTPTFAACVMYVENERWRGVPFFMTAGKNLHNRKAEVRIRFKKGHSMDFFPGEEVSRRWHSTLLAFLVAAEKKHRRQTFFFFAEDGHHHADWTRFFSVTLSFACTCVHTDFVF